MFDVHLKRETRNGGRLASTLVRVGVVNSLLNLLAAKDYHKGNFKHQVSDGKFWNVQVEEPAAFSGGALDLLTISPSLNML